MPCGEEEGAELIDLTIDISEPEDTPLYSPARTVQSSLPTPVRFRADRQKDAPQGTSAPEHKASALSSNTGKSSSSKQPDPKHLKDFDAVVEQSPLGQQHPTSATAPGKPEGAGQKASPPAQHSRVHIAPAGPAFPIHPLRSQWHAQQSLATEQAVNVTGRADSRLKECQPSAESAIKPASTLPSKSQPQEQVSGLSTKPGHQQQQQQESGNMSAKPMIGHAIVRNSTSPTAGSAQVHYEVNPGKDVAAAAAAPTLPSARSATSAAAASKAPSLTLPVRPAVPSDDRTHPQAVRNLVEAFNKPVAVQSNGPVRSPQRTASEALKQLMSDPTLSKKGPRPCTPNAPELAASSAAAAAAAASQQGPSRRNTSELVSFAKAKHAAAARKSAAQPSFNAPAAASAAPADDRPLRLPPDDKPPSAPKLQPEAPPANARLKRSLFGGLPSILDKLQSAATSGTSQHLEGLPNALPFGKRQLHPAASPAESMLKELVAAANGLSGNPPDPQPATAAPTATAVLGSSAHGTPSNPLPKPDAPQTPGPIGSHLPLGSGLPSPSTATAGPEAPQQLAAKAGTVLPSLSGPTPVRKAKLLKTKKSPQGRLGSPSFTSRPGSTLKQESQQASGDPSVDQNISKLCDQLCPQGSGSSTSEAEAIFSQPSGTPTRFSRMSGQVASAAQLGLHHPAGLHMQKLTSSSPAGFRLQQHGERASNGAQQGVAAPSQDQPQAEIGLAPSPEPGLPAPASSAGLTMGHVQGVTEKFQDPSGTVRDTPDSKSDPWLSPIDGTTVSSEQPRSRIFIPSPDIFTPPPSGAAVEHLAAATWLGQAADLSGAANAAAKHVHPAPPARDPGGLDFGECSMRLPTVPTSAASRPKCSAAPDGHGAADAAGQLSGENARATVAADAAAMGKSAAWPPGPCCRVRLSCPSRKEKAGASPPAEDDGQPTATSDRRVSGNDQPVAMPMATAPPPSGPAAAAPPGPASTTAAILSGPAAATTATAAAAPMATAMAAAADSRAAVPGPGEASRDNQPRVSQGQHMAHKRPAGSIVVKLQLKAPRQSHKRLTGDEALLQEQPFAAVDAPRKTRRRSNVTAMPAPEDDDPRWNHECLSYEPHRSARDPWFIRHKGLFGDVGEITRGFQTKELAFEAFQKIAQPRRGGKRKAAPEADEAARPSKRRCPATAEQQGQSHAGHSRSPEERHRCGESKSPSQRHPPASTGGNESARPSPQEIFLDRSCGKWACFLHVGKICFLGYYGSPELATAAWEAAKKDANTAKCVEDMPLSDTTRFCNIITGDAYDLLFQTDDMEQRGVHSDTVKLHLPPAGPLTCFETQASELCSTIQQLMIKSSRFRLARLQQICSIKDLPEGHPAVTTGRKQQRQRERGVFATKALPKFHLVEEYSGMLMTGTEIDSHNSHASRDGIAGFYSDKCLPFEYFNVDGGTELVVNAFEDGSGMQLINDFREIAAEKNVFTVEASHTKNGILMLHHLVITSKPIAAGEELLLDYGPGWWNHFQEEEKRAASVMAGREEIKQLAAAREIEVAMRQQAESAMLAAQVDRADVQKRLDAAEAKKLRKELRQLQRKYKEGAELRQQLAESQLAHEASTYKVKELMLMLEAESRAHANSRQAAENQAENARIKGKHAAEQLTSRELRLQSQLRQQQREAEAQKQVSLEEIKALKASLQAQSLALTCAEEAEQAVEIKRADRELECQGLRQLLTLAWKDRPLSTTERSGDSVAAAADAGAASAAPALAAP
ncbi:hypothetical protein WJX74_004627 [Apatococcus lobatus]|uniref:SET domain-containing protein n=1 Tax=Apatococcus lobatus TaxID=904363 RepID=A0AAW1R235_9CHLO